MSEPVALRWVAIEAFRGFRDRIELDLDSSAVIITGPNGTGKTSFFDAFQWLFLGHIDRLHDLRVRQTDEFIVNQYRLPGPATVEAGMWIGHETIRLRRAGNARTDLLELESDDGRVRRGEEAEDLLHELLCPNPAVDMASALMTSAILQQDLMRSLIEAKASDRFRFMNELLGLQALEEFEQAARTRLKEATDVANKARADEESSRRARAASETSLETAIARATRRPSVALATSELRAVVATHNDLVQVDVDSLGDVDGTNQLVADTRLAHGRLVRILSGLPTLLAERDEVVPVSNTDLDRMNQVVRDAQSQADARLNELRRLQQDEDEAEARAGQLARLAALAIPLLEEHCPVCGQPIDADHVASELQARATDSGDLLAIRRAREVAAQAQSAAEATLREARQNLAHLQDQGRRIVDLDRRRRELQSALDSLPSILVSIRLTDAERDVLDTTWIERVAAALQELEQAAERLTAAQGAANEVDQERGLRAQVAQLVDTEQTRRRRVEELAGRQTQAKALVDATVEARVAVVQRRVDSLRPIVSEIFSRLDPHPAFKELDLEHDVYRARGTTVTVARDPLEGISANPALVFSSAQANIAALSYFLALGWSAGHAAFPFLLLDDPIQSMDDVNVLGFSDLCRFIRADRQLLLSTHEHRFANLLERKLAPRVEEERTIMVEFTGWDRSGPDIQTRIVEPQLSAVSARLSAA